MSYSYIFLEVFLRATVRIPDEYLETNVSSETSRADVQIDYMHQNLIGYQFI